MKLLITGINGFLGKNVLHFFKDKCDVKGISREPQKLEGIEVYGSKNLNEITFEPDFIVMCHATVSSGLNKAGIIDLFETNVNLTKQILEKFAHSKVIYLSTVSVYKSSIEAITENSEILPKTDYAISKFWGEQIVRTHKNSIILRVSSIFGKNMRPNTIIPNYVNQAINNKEIQVWGDGSRIQNYINVTDVVNYIQAIIENFDQFNKSIFLGVSGKEYSNIELANIIADILGANILFVKEDLSQSYRYDNSFTKKSLKLAKEMSIDEGLEKYILWRKK